MYNFNVNESFYLKNNSNGSEVDINDIKFEDYSSNLNILDETKQILLLISDKFWNVNGKKIKIIEIFNK